jgi:drug/metabolite transporter (DMT)-like permease
VLVAILCGVGFGFYFFCIGHTHRSSGLWPTVTSFLVGIAVIAPIAARSGVLPTAASLSRLAVAGGLALGVADAALTIALQRGPLTVASVLGNLYPLVTIALGVTLLRERVRIWQAAGIALAVAGVAMIAGGQ